MSSQRLQDCTAVILAGGLGTRLRSVVSDRPKVLALVNGRPFLSYLLQQVANVGIKHVVLCTGYMADQVQTIFGENWHGLQISYSVENTPLGTGGALRLVLPQIQSEIALVLNGDSYCDADMLSFWDWHQSKNALGSLLLTQVVDTKRFGRVLTDSNFRVSEFEEKGNAQGEGWINAGIYLLSHSYLSDIPKGCQVSLEKRMFPKWISQGLYGYPSISKFIDIGTPDSYAQATQFFTHKPFSKCSS